jgi:hypothetical protein
MSHMTAIKAASCKLQCGTIYGTGFFISTDTLLTCLHNIDEKKEIKGETHGVNKQSLELELIDADPETDLAILRVKNGLTHPGVLHICSLEPVMGISWESFGYPDTINGRSIGETLSGTIKDYFEHEGFPQHDIVLAVEGFNINTSVYKGFSGSPCVDAYGNAVAILRHYSNNSLDAVSIKRVKPLLERNGIVYKQDYLYDFEEYSCNCFAGFDENPKRMCNSYATAIKLDTKPGTITQDLLGKLYYPHKNGTLEEIITYLKKNPHTNQRLWKGWLELLSYISIIPSTRTDFNSISITLTSEKFAELFGVQRETGPDTIDVKLNFFWTEGEGYLNIVRDYIHDKLKTGIENNTCYIFNSPDANYGRSPLGPGFKQNIITNIGGDDSAGLHIVKEMNYGMLSLNQISQQVLECDTEAQARPKIEQLFINALQNG